MAIAFLIPVAAAINVVVLRAAAAKLDLIPAVASLRAAARHAPIFTGNSHRHAPDGWLPAMKYLVEELKADVNQRDLNGMTPLHHAASRGDNEMILYLVSKGADVKATITDADGEVIREAADPPTLTLTFERAQRPPPARYRTLKRRSGPLRQASPAQVLNAASRVASWVFSVA
jgi:hypothetical protein